MKDHACHIDNHEIFRKSDKIFGDILKLLETMVQLTNPKQEHKLKVYLTRMVFIGPDSAINDRIKSHLPDYMKNPNYISWEIHWGSSYYGECVMNDADITSIEKTTEIKVENRTGIFGIGRDTEEDKRTSREFISL